MQDTVREALDKQSKDLLNDLRSLVAHRGSTPQKREELAHELLSQTAEVALIKSSTFDSTRPFRLWFLGIARNCLKQQYDGYAKRTISADSDVDFLETLQEAQTSDFADSVANRAWVQDLFERLSQDDREILQLAIVEELSSEEIGTLLGIAAGTARMRLLRALNRARQQAELMERIISVRGSR
ncbi:RNA polymerase sigma factor [Armatimonas sp.]|uniref:RNA polymerase sigma factor n=1 Tax=Armatimonas sp. TaxID=1872638 RepID=UPI00374CC2F6